MTNGVDGYDPFEFVPEQISPITATGLARLDEQLSQENTARLRSLPIEHQASVLATLMKSGAVGVRASAVGGSPRRRSDPRQRRGKRPRGGQPMSRQPYTASGPARCSRCGRERGTLRVVDGRYYCRGCLL